MYDIFRNIKLLISASFHWAKSIPSYVPQIEGRRLNISLTGIPERDNGGRRKKSLELGMPNLENAQLQKDEQTSV